MPADPMSSGAGNPLDAGEGPDAAEEMHMRSFKKAIAGGDTRGMRDAMKAFFEICYDKHEAEKAAGGNPGNPEEPPLRY